MIEILCDISLESVQLIVTVHCSLLVGEIRDQETAEIAVQSALTGHLVFSTLHTNDSASAITRLVDIGVEPFLISSSVLAVIAQRLIRVLCKDCKEAYKPDRMTLDSIDITPEQSEQVTLYRANGCESCIHTGYRGRTGIFEMMILESSLKSLILKDGVDKVLTGVSTIEEVIRVTQN